MEIGLDFDLRDALLEFLPRLGPDRLLAGFYSRFWQVFFTDAKRPARFSRRAFFVSGLRRFQCVRELLFEHLIAAIQADGLKTLLRQPVRRALAAVAMVTVDYQR